MDYTTEQLAPALGRVFVCNSCDYAWVLVNIYGIVDAEPVANTHKINVHAVCPECKNLVQMQIMGRTIEKNMNPTEVVIHDPLG